MEMPEGKYTCSRSQNVAKKKRNKRDKPWMTRNFRHDGRKKSKPRSTKIQGNQQEN